MIENLLLLYLVGWLITTDLLLAWFGTAFPAHLMGLLDWEDFRNWCKLGLGSRGKLLAWLGSLLICPVCLGHWFSAAVALTICYLFGLKLICSLVAIFTWPLLSFIVLKKLGTV